MMKLSSEQVRALIQNAYDGKYKNVDDTYRVINFSHLKTKSVNKPYTSTQKSYQDYILALAKDNSVDADEYNQLKETKLKCFTNYLNTKSEQRTITIDKYNKSNTDNLIHLDSKVSVTLHADNMHNYRRYVANDVAFVIFSNKHIGGLILTSGCAQEEIKFMQNPELLYLKINQATLTNNEVFIISNVRKYNSTTGYGFDVEFVEDRNSNYRETFILMDAINYSFDISLQYLKASKDREINKCMTAFSNVKETNIVTGDWGYGAFKGDHELKFMIQLYCAFMCNKHLHYFSTRIGSNVVSKYENMSESCLLKNIYEYYEVQ